ncbi:hypothetical protein HHK36_026968 [Tetracentron sinense]|uniref:Pentatricopeptide repeat-containing protein n=1 Tax=Tetracentron sinense TaxID=13715 RepID=A0A834YGJ8_TETSI|nr:hypothetical protein HHK36_026968 [Tetracentron sinense]
MVPSSISSSFLFFFAHKSFTHINSRFYTSATTVFYTSHHLLQLLQFSINHKSLKLIQQSHTRIYSLGCDQDPFLATKLISAYSICGVPRDSRTVFNLIFHKSLVLWNSLISGYAKNGIYKEAFDLFNQMCWGGEKPDNYTLATLLKISGNVGDLETGKMVHCKSIQMGFVSDTVLANSLMAMYCKCENFGDLRKLFDEMLHRNTASWNVLISGYGIPGNFVFNEDMWELVKQMQIEGIKLDGYTVSSLLPLCGTGKGKWDYGRELHCFIVKNELALGSDVHVGCCLIDMYSKSKNVIMGRRVFDRMSCKNVVAWTSMITGYVQNGGSEEALNLFREMQSREGIEPNRVSLVSVLPACSALAGLIEGKQIHGFAIRNELNHEVSLGNALIDLYSKCGSLDCARRVFHNDSFCKDTISWSSMITGYGLHGKGQEAIFLYNKMLQLGIKPDVITFLGVLSACGRSGLVTEGLNLYSSIIMDFGITPTVEICACVVDMLGRSGQLDQALDFINSMPMRPGPSVWGALVGACIIHGNFEMRDLAYRFLIQLEPENPSNYVSLSNVYASSGRWDVVAEVRTRMKEKGLRKFPGCSWININSKTHSFYVADKAHSCSNLIHEMLDDLKLTMKGAAYVPDLEILT